MLIKLAQLEILKLLYVLRIFDYVGVSNTCIGKKVKVTLEQATKAHNWSRSIALLFL